MDIPGIGLYIGFVDSEGNRVSIIQPAPMMWVLSRYRVAGLEAAVRG